jgi:hypothetical protein
MASDFINFVLEMRSGAVAADINSKFNELLQAVMETTGKGELTIKFTIKPSRLAMGGAVVEIEAEHDCKMKKPQLSIGHSLFYVNEDGELLREDPAQSQMFEKDQSTEKEKFNGK